MDKIELTAKLKNVESIKNSSKQEYLDRNVELLVNQIENCSAEIKSAIEKWLSSNIETEMEMFGIRYSDLLSKAKMTPLAAYLTLDWVSRESNIAISELKKEYSL